MEQENIARSRKIIGGLGLFFLALGLISVLFLSSRQSSDIEIIPASEVEGQLGKGLVIDVAGAVQNPGVYELKDGSRFNDALIAAGGLSASADREWVAKSLNLASLLKDGSKIYIKSVSETQNAVINDQITGVSEGKININTASIAVLDQLPGIGPVTAQKIIDWRNNNGSYSSVEDILKVPGIGQSLFDKIKDRLVVW